MIVTVFLIVTHLVIVTHNGYLHVDCYSTAMVSLLQGNSDGIMRQ